MYHLVSFLRGDMLALWSFRKRITCFYSFQKALVTVLAFYSEIYTDSESVKEPLCISQSASLYVTHRTLVQMRIDLASCY